MRTAVLNRKISTVALCAALLLGACGAKDRSGRFSTALGQALRAGSITRIDLASLDAPVWDELFVFGSKTSRDDACLVLALGWLECRTTIPTTLPDDEEFLVFRVKGRVSRAERHSRSNGDFLGGAVPPPQPILRASSIFLVAPAAASGDAATRAFALSHVD